MKGVSSEINHPVKRTLKHICCVFFVICWFAIWYGIFGLLTGLWHVKLWSNEILIMYCALSLWSGLPYEYNEKKANVFKPLDEFFLSNYFRVLVV